MTSSLVQNARSFACDEIFGDPSQNVLFSNALVDKIEEGGHNVLMVLKDWLEVMKMLDVLFSLTKQGKEMHKES